MDPEKERLRSEVNRPGGTLISDLSACQPGGSLTRVPKDGYWSLVDYEAENTKGTMVWAGPGGAPELRLSLGVRGWHDIYLGICYASILGEQKIGLMLEGESGFHWLAKEMFPPKDGDLGRKPEHFELNESFWRSVDLREEDLVISESFEGRMACLAYVRLITCEDGPEQAQPDDDSRRLVAIFDGFGVAHDFYQSEERIRDPIAPFQKTDVGMVLWGAVFGDCCMYESRVGATMDLNCWSGYHFSRDLAKNLLGLKALGVNPLKAAIEAAHDLGLEIYGSMRMAGAYLPPAHDMPPESFYARHPEYRCVDRDGNVTPHLSLAYPEVRERYIAVLKEMAELGTDGVHVLFCRSWPFVLYEEIAVGEFIQTHGRDPRKLPEDDPDWLAHKGSYVTEYIRAIREMADEVGRLRGRKLGTAYHVMNNLVNCHYFGLDVKTWVEKGLVDLLIPAPCHSTERPSDGKIETAAFAELARGTSCRICPDPLPKRQPAERFLPDAIPHYRSGADGLCFWDTDARTQRSGEWAVCRDLGHREELETWQARGKGKSYFRQVPIHKVCDFTLDRRYWPLTNG